MYTPYVDVNGTLAWSLLDVNPMTTSRLVVAYRV